MTLGKKIRILRLRKGLSQNDLAALCGLSRRTVTSYESDVSKPGSRRHYEQLADALGVNVTALLESDSEVLPLRDEADRIAGIESSPEANPGFSYEISAFLGNTRDIFADNRLSEQSKDMLMHAIQEIYWDVKKDCFLKAGSGARDFDFPAEECGEPESESENILISADKENE